MTPLVRYTLLQVPMWLFLACLMWWSVANNWIQLPVATWIMTAWILKDAALYPLCRHAFAAVPVVGPESLVGRETRAGTALAPDGRITLDGIRWPARSRDNQHIPAGHRIRVIRLDGLVLVVEPAM